MLVFMVLCLLVKHAGQDLDEPYKDDKPKYEKDYTLNKYVIVNDWKNGKINSNKNHRGFFPRMWSDNNTLNYIKYYGFLDLRSRGNLKIIHRLKK